MGIFNKVKFILDLPFLVCREGGDNEEDFFGEMVLEFFIYFPRESKDCYQFPKYFNRIAKKGGKL
jgi:hypothetical protein